MSGKDQHAAPATIIVPVHDEVVVLGRTLRDLLAQVDAIEHGGKAGSPRQIRIIVACNGCTDDSAELARTLDPRLEVIELPEASKPAALNRANNLANGHRVFIDADVSLSPTALADVLELLDRDEVDAAAPQPLLTAVQPSLPTRWYLDVWHRAPYWYSNLIGGGFYAIAEQAIAPLGDFPALIADDLFVLSSIPPHRRATTTASTFTHLVPDTLRAIHHQETRRLAGRDQFVQWSQARGLQADPVLGDRRWLTALMAQPRLAPKVALYLAVRLTARRRGQRALRRGSLRWGTAR